MLKWQIAGSLPIFRSGVNNAPLKKGWKYILADWDLYLLLMPGVLYFVIYKYLPMWGILLAFKDYSPFLGFWGSKWVGISHFIQLFSYDKFWLILRNTLLISLYNLIFYFPAPIILALLLNEVRNQVYKRIIQTVIYLPHFISWVVVAGITFLFFGSQGGIVNSFITSSGQEAVPFLTTPEWFRPLIILQSIWKEAGWGTIIILAALAGVDVQLYEAAIVDGAGRWKQLWHITLPAIRSTVVILLILRLGNILDVGFEQIFLMLNSMVNEVGDVFETYVYREGLVGGKFSFTIAVGLFKSVIGLVMVVFANWLAKKCGEEGIF